jgi:subtilisin family serine protease
MKQFYLFFLVVMVLQGNAQTAMSSSTIHDISTLVAKCEGKEINASFVKNQLSQYPVYLVNGEYCLSMIAKVSADAKHDLIDARFFVSTKIGNIATIKFPLKYLSTSFSHPQISYIEIAPRIQAFNNRMVADVRADSVWQGLNGAAGFSGKNVLIGIIDWGFDYEHPMFMDTTLSYLRIRAAWDQFKIIGNHPLGVNYGAEYLTPSSLAAAKSDTAGTYYDYATHGSHVAGIAAGSGAGTKYRGVAFDANYLFTSIQLDAGAVIDAYHWMKDIAAADGKRLVINMSWGLYYIGPMDGTSLFSQVIDNLSTQDIVFVSSAGNNGQSNFHIQKTFNNDSLRSRIGFYPYSAHPAMWGECVSMWGEPANPFSAKLEVYNASNILLAQTDFFNTNADAGYFDSILVINSDTVFYNYTVDSANPLNLRPFIQLRVKNTNTAYKIVLNSFAATGTVHYWNVVELSNGVGNWGLEFTSFGNNGVAGDSEYGIGEPACTESTITVAAHNSESSNAVGTLFPGIHAGFSSIGPTYDGRMKPDISAPGSSVISSINSYTTASFTSNLSIVFNGRTYHFSAFSGTSMSSPALVGVAALVLEANPQLSAQQVKNILKTTARQDSRTGIIQATGSPTWGMGKVTATDAVSLALNTVSIKQIGTNNHWELFPNPTNEYLTLIAKDYWENNLKYIVYNLQNQVVMNGNLDNNHQIEVSNLSSGIYFIKIISNRESWFAKFIKTK